ncbi:discoidin domain-containing protein [Hoylesella nanceiensis]|uniref:discoidin domain-containing protein n=1 Tax=Hoylesella nanceiensis TaxID=425941 RepID=UPI001C5EE7E8|nr:discoidin domain-containing protein [Hoylesella nanceiensis]MBW4766294.1 discoidin domain-containing protein [Hoylesella nanceiensis]
MNKIFKLGVPALFALVPFFTSCESDPEVGTPLYPVAAENTTAQLAIISDLPGGNTQTIKATKTGSSLVIKGDTISFYVKLTHALDKDITVSVKEDPTAATAGSNSFVLDAGSLDILTSSVTILKGTKRSTEPIKAVAKNGTALQKLLTEAKDGVTALVVDSVSGVSVAPQYKSMEVKFAYSETNLKEGGSVSALTALPTTDYAVYDASYNELSDLSNGSTADFWYSQKLNSEELIISLSNEITFKGLSLDRYAGYETFFLQSAKIATSVDGVTYTLQGEITFPSDFASATTPAEIQLYTGVKAQYIKIYDMKATMQNFAVVSEIKVYK